MKRVTLAVKCEIAGTPEGFRQAFDNLFRSHTRPDDPFYEINKAILEITIAKVCEVVEDPL